MTPAAQTRAVLWGAALLAAFFVFIMGRGYERTRAQPKPCDMCNVWCQLCQGDAGRGGPVPFVPKE